jgi:hypothetical protein
MDTEGKKPNDNSYIGRSIKFEENDDSGSNASMDTEAKKIVMSQEQLAR